MWLSTSSQHVSYIVFLFFSLKEGFLMPFTTISKKINCEDLLPLYPLPSSPVASSLHGPTSISYYKVLICHSPSFDHLYLVSNCTIYMTNTAASIKRVIFMDQSMINKSFSNFISSVNFTSTQSNLLPTF